MKRIAIRSFFAIACALITIDTIPKEWFPVTNFQDFIHRALDRTGLSQGSWPLFAPNPVLNNGVLIAEATDNNSQTATWSSIDWTQANAWEKFYRFRHMNYLQRLPNNALAAGDFAHYLLLAIPDRETAIPNVRWSEDNQMLEPQPITPPLQEVRLYHYRDRMSLPEGTPGIDYPFPPKDETVWSTQIGFMARRAREP